MSEFAFFRFSSFNLLTKEERESKEEIVKLTEEVLDANGIKCDASISKISEDELIRILAKVRELRRKKKNRSNKILEQQEEHMK
jgi:hypothetical protein